MCVCVYVCMYVCMFLFVCLFVCLFVRAHVYVGVNDKLHKPHLKLTTRYTFDSFI